MDDHITYKFCNALKKLKMFGSVTQFASRIPFIFILRDDVVPQNHFFLFRDNVVGILNDDI